MNAFAPPTAVAPLDLLLNRASVSKLGLPVPDEAALARIAAVVGRAPDHGALRPWRLLAITGAGGLARLAEAGAESLRRREPGATDAELVRIREKLTRAPMVIALAGRIAPHVKVPEVEQVLAVGAGGMNLLNALHALGFGAKWVTGGHSHDPLFAAALGFAPEERLAGLFMVGTPERAAAPGGVANGGVAADRAVPVRVWRD